MKRAGGRRYYRPRDVELVMALRHLLYGQGYTIKGVQRSQGARRARRRRKPARGPVSARFRRGAGRKRRGKRKRKTERWTKRAARGSAEPIRRRLAPREPPDLPPPAQERAFAPEGEALAPLVVRPDAPPPCSFPPSRGPCAKPGSRRGRRAPLAARAGRSRRVPPPAVAHNEMKTRRRRCHRARGPL